MIKMNRRQILGSAAALPLTASLAWAQEDVVVDVKALMEPPAEGDMELGNKDAKVTVVEYASASCPHCAAFANDVFPTVQKNYIDTGKIRFIFREFPHNDAALGAFMLARCAPKEKYFPLVDVFFKTQETWLAEPLKGLTDIALQAGFTQDSFKACIANKDVAKGILDVRSKADTFGVTGIPTFFINGKKYKDENSVEAFSKYLDSLLTA
jgi:protein-disulfide isomerase